MGEILCIFLHIFLFFLSGFMQNSGSDQQIVHPMCCIDALTVCPAFHNLPVGTLDLIPVFRSDMLYLQHHPNHHGICHPDRSQLGPVLLPEYSGWFYISCPVIWKSLFISAFCAYRIIISVETLVKTATHRRCGKVLTNIPTEMDKSSSTKEAISEYRNSDFQFSGSAISSHKNIHLPDLTVVTTRTAS